MHHICDRSQSAQGFDLTLAFLGRADVTKNKTDGLVAVGSREHADIRSECIRQLRIKLAIKTEHLAGFCDRIHEQTGDRRTNRMRTILKGHDNAEVSAAAAPELRRAAPKPRHHNPAHLRDRSFCCAYGILRNPQHDAAP